MSTSLTAAGRPKRQITPSVDDDAWLSVAQLMSECGVTNRCTVRRWQINPALNFPKPVMLNHRNYWRRGDVKQWRIARAAASAAKSTTKSAP
jgi:predicted DNA-binding transcriptional regulator AlpA